MNHCAKYLNVACVTITWFMTEVSVFPILQKDLYEK